MIVGQPRIKEELSYIIPQIVNGGKNINLLMVGRSGCGKTTLAYSLLNIFGFNSSQISGPPDFMFNSDLRFHFLDEVHQLESPEILYPILDSGQYTIIMATNELGDLKEPLINRCIPMIFTEYTTEELCQISNMVLGRWSLSNDKLLAIVRKCKGNPRIVKMLCQRLDNIFPYRMPGNSQELDEICTAVLGISPDGLTDIDRKYLEFLRTVGGTASLDLISNSLRLSRATLLREVEPHLVYLNLIQISSRGRTLL